MLRKVAVLAVHLAPCGILDTEALYRRDDDDGLPLNGRTREMQCLFDGHHLDRAARQFQRATVGVARVAQSINRLDQDGIARHKPEYHHLFCVQ